jgi:hypothetical protein
MDEPALHSLREQGFDDRAIHDAVQVIGYFNYITRVAEALGVEAEDFIRPWGTADSPDPRAEGSGSEPAPGRRPAT